MRDFFASQALRTDIAEESVEHFRRQNGTDLPGLASKSFTEDGFSVRLLHVSDARGEAASGKPRGRYLTMDIGRIWTADKARFRAAARVFAKCIRSFLPKELPRDAPCMLVSLGNRAIIADAVGPLAAAHFIVTRHILRADPELFRSLGMRETTCLVPDVSGNTGLEAAEIARGAAENARPGFIVAVDALACRRLSRLCTTLQLSDTGLSPGAGLYNKRQSFDRAVFGCPVLAIGVPTVVEVPTLALDVLQTALERAGMPETDSKTSERLLDALEKTLRTQDGDGYFVTPGETDHIVKDVSKLIGYALNLALHDGLAFDDIDEFLS